MAGRKPLPTEIKKLRGTLQKCRTNPLEPQPHGDLVAPPEYMSDGAKQAWRYAIESAPEHLLRKLDMSVLEVWSCAAGRAVGWGCGANGTVGNGLGASGNLPNSFVMLDRKIVDFSTSGYCSAGDDIVMAHHFLTTDGRVYTTGASSNYMNGDTLGNARNAPSQIIF